MISKLCYTGGEHRQNGYFMALELTRKDIEEIFYRASNEFCFFVCPKEHSSTWSSDMISDPIGAAGLAKKTILEKTVPAREIAVIRFWDAEEDFSTLSSIAFFHYCLLPFASHLFSQHKHPYPKWLLTVPTNAERAPKSDVLVEELARRGSLLLADDTYEQQSSSFKFDAAIKPLIKRGCWAKNENDLRSRVSMPSLAKFTGSFDDETERNLYSSLVRFKLSAKVFSSFYIETPECVFDAFMPNWPRVKGAGLACIDIKGSRENTRVFRMAPVSAFTLNMLPKHRENIPDSVAGFAAVIERLEEAAAVWGSFAFGKEELASEVQSLREKCRMASVVGKEDLAVGAVRAFGEEQGIFTMLDTIASGDVPVEDVLGKQVC